MSISSEDQNLMVEVAKYFNKTKEMSPSEGSIKETAEKFGINRNKVRKILITMGELTSPLTEKAMELKEKGMTIVEIAAVLGVSTATVSMYLPYDQKIRNSLDPSKHAKEVREYRAYERKQAERQVRRNEEGENKSRISSQRKRSGNEMNETADIKEWKKDIGMSYKETYHRPHRFSREELGISSGGKVLRSQFDGALNDRNEEVLEKIAGNPLPPEPIGVWRLHLELISESGYDEETINILRKYGNLQYGDCISRDLVVPEDIPLYALHYAIQRAFGWENSHLRRFFLSEKRFEEITEGTAGMWSRLVGILFRSPLMDAEDEFWADDYEQGSFKNWLRKKYTGPYLSQCHGEGFITCRKDMGRIDPEEKYYVLYTNSYNQKTGRYDGEKYVSEVISVYDWEGKKRQAPKPWFDKQTDYRVEIMQLREVPSSGIKFLFENSTDSLLERLPVCDVLVAGEDYLPGDQREDRRFAEAQIIRSGSDLLKKTRKFADQILKANADIPYFQPILSPVAEEVYYKYDFGDNWTIRITASNNCKDLVESGRISQNDLDRANVKCREVYRPVLIAKDGEMLMDDVGGIYGFAEFLEDIHPDMNVLTSEEKEYAKRQKQNMLQWARGMGWHKEKCTDFNLL